MVKKKGKLKPSVVCGKERMDDMGLGSGLPPSLHQGNSTKRASLGRQTAEGAALTKPAPPFSLLPAKCKWGVGILLIDRPFEPWRQL